MSQYCSMTTKDFLPECGREEKGADKCQKDRDQQLGKVNWLR